MENKPDNEGGKLEWMYKKSQVEKEEYLLGRAVDKAFEQGDASANVAVGKTHKDTVPAPLLSKVTSIADVEHVDLARKIHEDPLYAIKKKEIERREQLLKNPVKLKKLRHMLNKQRNKIEKDRLKKQKKKKKKRRREKGKSDEDSDSEDDIDSLLVKKYQKLKQKFNLEDISKLSSDESSSDESSGKSNRSMKASKEIRRDDDYGNRKFKRNSERTKKDSEDEIRHRSYLSRSDRDHRHRDERNYSKVRGRGNERNRSDSESDTDDDRAKSIKKKRRNTRNDSSESSNMAESSDELRKREKDRNHARKSSVEKSCKSNSKHKKIDKLKNSHKKHEDSDTSKSGGESRESKKRSKQKLSCSDSDSSEPVKHKSQKFSTKSNERGRKDDNIEADSKKKVAEKSQKESKYSSSSEASEDYDSDGQVIPKKKFGLVIPKGKTCDDTDGKKIEERVEVIKKEKEVPKSFQRTKPMKLSEKEKEARRKEMMKNAEWRDDLRKKNIKSYKEKEDQEKEKQKDYSNDFYRNELSKAASHASVEGRIKSNINRIQRNPSSMDSHFSRR